MTIYNISQEVFFCVVRRCAVQSFAHGVALKEEKYEKVHSFTRRGHNKCEGDIV